MSFRIVASPDVFGGRPVLAGHRIRVSDIVIWHEHQGLTPDAIVSQIPSLTLADVHAALGYYYDNLDAIRDELRVESETADRYEASTQSLLKVKLSQVKRSS